MACIKEQIKTKTKQRDKQKANDRVIDLNTTESIIALNVNVLNIPIKTQKLSD